MPAADSCRLEPAVTVTAFSSGRESPGLAKRAGTTRPGARAYTTITSTRRPARGRAARPFKLARPWAGPARDLEWRAPATVTAGPGGSEAVTVTAYSLQGSLLSRLAFEIA